MAKYFDISKIPSLMRTVLTAFPTTLKLLVLSTVIGLCIGVVLAAMLLSKYKILNGIARVYVNFMRGMPTLVLIFILYFVSPIYLKKIGFNTNAWSKDSFVIATLAISSAASMAEMMRSAYLSVDIYQWEAAYSVGMGSVTAFFRIIFPQAFGVAIPNLGNNIVSIFKSTSLAFSIGAIDMFGQAKLITNRLYGLNKSELYLGVAIIFWAICVFMERVTKWAEIRYSKGKKLTATGEQ